MVLRHRGCVAVARVTDRRLTVDPTDFMQSYGPLCTAFYDADKPSAPADAVTYYLQRARQAGGPVLEPMCGSGRFLLPLLRAGVDIDGVDAAPAMLEACRRRTLGFVMLWDDTLNTVVQHRPEVYLWRLMVAAPFEGQGIGKKCLGLILDHVRSRPGIARFHSSYVPGEPSLAHFYLSFGFVPNGETDEDGEVVIEYPLAPVTAA